MGDPDIVALVTFDPPSLGAKQFGRRLIARRTLRAGQYHAGKFFPLVLTSRRRFSARS